MKEIYLLVGTYSDYDNQGHWTVGAYVRRRHAEMDRKVLQKLADRVTRAHGALAARGFSDNTEFQRAIDLIGQFDAYHGSNHDVTYDIEVSEIADRPVVPAEVAILEELTQ